jgi:hypothetical protein
MATHTKILDLFGIPACGKSTLAKNVCYNCDSGLKVITLSHLIGVAKKNNSRLLKAMPLKYFLAGLRLRLLAPFNKTHLRIPFINWPSHARYYWYAKRYTDYDIVIADHGDIQDFVSLEGGVDLHKQKKFSEECSKYIKSSLADIYVYCKIDPKEALTRIRQRGREAGRIDMIEDYDKQLQALKDEKKRFDFFAQMLLSQGKELIELEMSNTTEHNARILTDKIRKKK